MNRDEPGFPRGPLSEDGEQIGPLLRLAGPREAVPADRMQRVKTAVRAEWRRETCARSRRMTIGWSLGAVAAAAVVVFGVRLAVRDDAVLSLRRDIATIEAFSGAGPTVFQVGDRLQEGDGLDTTTGGQAVLRLAGGASVKIDRGTRLRLISEASMALDEGAIYVDSGERSGARSLEIRTRLGAVHDIGTRFEVRLTESALRVRVRDGVVQLHHSRQSHNAGSGDELTLDESGSIHRRMVPVHGADWGWVAALAPPFGLEGRSLRVFLDWITGENGWQLRFADAAVEEKSVSTILHGSIEGLTQEEMLAAVLPASGIGYRLENGVLLVRLGTGDTKD